MHSNNHLFAHFIEWTLTYSLNTHSEDERIRLVNVIETAYLVFVRHMFDGSQPESLSNLAARLGGRQTNPSQTDIKNMKMTQPKNKVSGLSNVPCNFDTAHIQVC